MPRPHRPLVAGALYHVYTRGNDRQAIFREESDRSFWISLMRQARENFSCRFLAYCLMTNHIHLAIETPQPNLNKVMESLNRCYTRHFNGKYGHVGHLFQGRYRAKLVEKDRYLLALVRYIHLNPVKAGMAYDAGAYPWSSHGYYAGLKPDTLVDAGQGLALFSENPEAARAHYLGFLQKPIPSREWKKLDSPRNGVLGDRAALLGGLAQGGTFRGGKPQKVAASF